MKSRKRSEAARKGARTKGPTVRSRAGLKALRKFPKDTVDREDLSRQAREAAADRSKGERVSAGRRAARTRARND